MRRNVRRNNRQESSQERQDGRQEAAAGSPRETVGLSEKLDVTANSVLPLNSEVETWIPSQKNKISIRQPNRDYTKSITWTYELNKDVYSIYIKAKVDGQDYMKRMKEMWDIMHPDLNITARNL